MTGAAGRGVSAITAVGQTATVAYTVGANTTFILPLGPTGATGPTGMTGMTGMTGPAGADGTATVDAASIIGAVTGTPTTTDNVIKWQTGGSLAWAADGGGGGGGVTTIAGPSSFSETPTTLTFAGNVVMTQSTDNVTVSVTGDGTGVTTVTGSGGFTQTPSTVRFTGAGVSLVGTDTVTVTIPGGGGGGAAAAVVAFRTAIDSDLINSDHTTWQHVMDFQDADIAINQGSFTHANGSATDMTERLIIPEDGFYSIGASIYTRGITGSRQSQWIRFTIERAGTETGQPERGVAYSRQSLSSGQTSTTGQNELGGDLPVGDGRPDRRADARRGRLERLDGPRPGEFR